MPTRLDLPCSQCGKLMWRSATSLPAGQATCRACRGYRPDPLPRGARGPLSCARCGKKMASSKSSRPQGEATCQACRRIEPGPFRTPERPVLESRCCEWCGNDYGARYPTQRYCSPACRIERREQRIGWDRAKTSSVSRGYGAGHRAVRAQWRPIVEAGQATCCLCGQGIAPNARWHLDHTPDRTGYRGAAHASCNVKDGAQRGRGRQRTGG